MRGANSPWRDSVVRAQKKARGPKIVHEAPRVLGEMSEEGLQDERTLSELIASYRPKLPPGRFNFADPAGEALHAATLRAINQQFARRIFKPTWED